MKSLLDPYLIIFLLAGTLIVILLVMVIIFFIFNSHHKILQQNNTIQERKLAHHQQLIQATLQAEEKEKQRLSKNVRDKMGTYASLLKMNVSRLTLLSNQNISTQQLLSEQKNLITDMTSFVRKISMELSSPTVKDFGVIAGIEELITMIKKTAAISFTFKYGEKDTRFDHNTETQIFRVVKELLNNLIKHAQPNQVIIKFNSSNSFINLIISHNGAGLSTDDYQQLYLQSRGFGLKSIETRIQSLEGIISYKKEKLKYLIRLKIPLSYE